MRPGLFKISPPWPIGCDIGVGEVRLAQVVASSGHAARVTVAEHPVDARPGDAQWRPSAVRALRAAVRDGKFPDNRAVTCLPVDSLGVRGLRLPPMPDGELTAAAHFAATKELGVSPGSMKSATLKLGKVRDGRHIEVATVAAPVTLLEEQTAMLLEAGLEPMAIDGSPWAYARILTGALARPEARSLPLLLVEVGSTATSVAVACAGQLRLLRTVDLGAARLPQILSRRLGIPVEEARVVCAESRGAGACQASQAHDIEDSLRMFARELAREVLLCINYYTDALGNAPPTTGVLVGAESSVDVAEVVGELTGVDVRLPGAFLPADLLGGTADAGQWAKAAGLSIYQMDGVEEAAA